MISKWPTGSLEDFASLLCGEQLGKGSQRATYVCRMDKTKVVKVELDTYAAYFQNLMEWEVWNALKHTRVARFLAPCHYISEGGRVLVQSRVYPLRPEEKRAARLPDFMTDFQDCNFGILDGAVVCCDYGLVGKLIGRGAMKYKLRKPDWTS